jgi:hypothetical protein
LDEDKVVVHELDRAAIEAQIRAHSARCPSTAIRQPSNVYRTIDAQCDEHSTCQELETIYYVDDPSVER